MRALAPARSRWPRAPPRAPRRRPASRSGGASGRAGAPAASRPFDRRRNGMVLGEGAGVFVVERPEFARARGATVHAEVLGWGATSDAYHPTTPRPDGSSAAESMRIALRDTGLTVG